MGFKKFWKKAIVVSSDLSKYELNSTGEYTQGAGAIALLITNHTNTTIDNAWGIATKSENDFLKPRRTFNKKDLINEIISKLNLNITDSDFEEKFSESIFWNNNSEIIETRTNLFLMDNFLILAMLIECRKHLFI